MQSLGHFLKWFVGGGSETELDGRTWEMLDTERATRDSGVVHGKIDYLVALMEQYFRETEKRHSGKFKGRASLSPHTKESEGTICIQYQVL